MSNLNPAKWASSIENAILDPIEDWFDDLGGDITKSFNRLGNDITRSFTSWGNAILKPVTQTLNTVKTLFYCTIAFFNFIVALFEYGFNFSVWFFVYFLPWTGQYFECAWQKIIYLPKCFFWYAIDCITWVIYLPFRFLFWLIDYIFNIGLEDAIHDYFWCPLEDLDKFIHDDGPSNLGTGIHIIHFPDSVMDKCYNCNIKPIGRKMPNTCNLMKAYCKFVNCNGSNKCITTKCSSTISKYMEPKSKSSSSATISDK